VVLHLGWQLEMMEYFGADGSARVVDACAKKVGEADVVLGILGWRRGGVPGTERGGDGDASYRAANRFSFDPVIGSEDMGFRVVLPAAPSG
jgi:hypothetical protein